MRLKVVADNVFRSGDLVTVKSMSPKERFCIIGFKETQGKERIAILKALFNDTYIIEKPVSELESLLLKGLL
jgi:hypothetical protein